MIFEAARAGCGARAPRARQAPARCVRATQRDHAAWRPGITRAPDLPRAREAWWSHWLPWRGQGARGTRGARTRGAANTNAPLPLCRVAPRRRHARILAAAACVARLFDGGVACNAASARRQLLQRAQVSRVAAAGLCTCPDTLPPPTPRPACCTPSAQQIQQQQRQQQHLCRRCAQQQWRVRVGA